MPRIEPEFNDNLEDPDAFYEALMQAHEGLPETQSQLLNARLVLIMANMIGKQAELEACIRAARHQLPPA